MEDDFTNKKQAGGLGQEHIRGGYDTGVQGDTQAGYEGTAGGNLDAEKQARVAGGDSSPTRVGWGEKPTIPDGELAT